MSDLVIIGGGIVGMSAAYYAVQSGARTVLIDRADTGQATAAGAGILSPETSAHASDEWLALAYRAVDDYPHLVAALQAMGAGDTGYAPRAQLVVAISPDEDTAFEAMYAAVQARRDQTGRPAPADIGRVDNAGAHELFPLLAPVRHALYFARAAQVDGRLLTNALRAAALARGLQLITGSVDALHLRGDRVSALSVNGQTIGGDAFILAGGAWTARLAAPLEIKLPVAPQRGQIIHLSLPGTDTTHFPIISAFHGHYLVPWNDSRVVVGATRETGSGFKPFTSAAGIRQVLDEALRVAPGLADAAVAEIRVGLRPLSPDGLPILGAISTARNVWLAAGHGATGLTLGPYSGKLVAHLALGIPPPLDLAPFSLARFVGTE